MKLKLDDQGHAVVQDGNPVYVYDDGKELPFDAKSTVTTIARLNTEARDHRVAKETLETKYSKIPADFDFDAATKAMDTVKNLTGKQAIDASELDKLKGEAVRSALNDFETNKYKPLKTENEQLKAKNRELVIGHAFAGSKYIAEKLSIPSDMTRSHFGHLLKVEDDKLVGYDMTGNKVFSRKQPGEDASFEEWIEVIVDQYPFRDNILKGSGASGSGAANSRNSGGQDLSKLPPIARMDAARANRK